jgi:fumarate reductase subunit D
MESHTMPQLTLLFGGLLIALGPIGYALSDKGPAAMTAFIATVFGILLVICGLVAMNPGRRKHAMHAAAVVGLLGMLLPLGRLVPTLIKGNEVSAAAWVSLGGMVVLCLIFFLLCFKSFLDARKARLG